MNIRFLQRLLLLFLSVFFLAEKPGKAQSVRNSMDFINPGEKRVTFRFKLTNNLIIIPVIINDSDTLHFILDTGISNTIITELSLGDSLSLNYARQIKMNGLGSGEPVDALISYGNVFTIPGTRGYNQNVYVLLQNIFNLSSILGTRVQGLVGYNIFGRFIVRINYEKRVITLYNPDDYVYKYGKRERTLPLIITKTKPYIYSSLINEKGKEVHVKLLIDTGASYGLWLNTGTGEGLELPSKTVDTYLGSGLSGRINGKLGRIPLFNLGPFSFHNPVVAYPDTLSVLHTMFVEGRNGSLGSEILRRFHVLIDYPNHRITLRPNKFYKDPFRVNRAGITVTTPIPGIPYYLISDIRKQSPAARAGLKKGDKIENINNKYVIHMNLDDIYKIFEGKPGRKIKMVVIRNGLPFVTYFYLEDFI